MNRRVAIYCPDQHLVYDIRTLDRAGVGGGVTGRIRLAHALAALGHEVTACVNCPDQATIGGVRYQHFSRLQQLEADILVAGTSGGAQDLSPLGEVRVQAALRVFMVDGVAAPHGLHCQPFDFASVPSNFVRGAVVERWEFTTDKVFVCYRGAAGALFETRWARPPQRDPFAIAYAGHPSKGLDEAIAVLRLLRKEKPRFTLHVYGGSRLWGEDERPAHPEPGVVYHGLIGQKRLARELLACGFSLNLQAREEPFGLAVVEAMRAGCIVLASPVGAYPEIIRDGYDGFLIEGAHTHPETYEQTARLILHLLRQPDYADYIRRNAAAAPLDWDTVARAWTGHWDWVLSGKPTASLIESACAACGGAGLPLADGLHCIRCGRYQRSLAP